MMETNKNPYSSNSGFKVPEDYFGNIEDKVLDKVAGSESSNIPVMESGFIVPEDYFKGLDQIILEKVAKKPKVIRLVKKEYIFYAAAVAALFVLMIGDFFKTSPTPTLGWEDVEISAMENYIDEGYEMGYIKLNTSDYSDYVPNGENLVDEEDFNKINSDAALDYLDENLEDPTYILD